MGRARDLAALGSAVRGVLDVPTRAGGDATGTWAIGISGNAATVTNGVYTAGNQSIAGNKTFSGVLGLGAGWTAEQSGTDILFKYNGANRFKVDASGNATFAGNVTAYGAV